MTDNEDLKAAYSAVIATPEGRRVIFDILELSGIYGVAFTGDNNQTNFRLGMQEAGKRVIAMLNEIDARLYPQLLMSIAGEAEMNKAASAAQQRNEDDDIYA